MKPSIHLGLRTLLALPLTFVTVAALAQSGSPADLSRVEISGQKLPTVTRFDVRATCPDIDKSLPELLAVAWAREMRPAVVNVQFTLKGKEMTGVRALNGPFEYRTPVRRAVRSLDCGSDSTQEQQFKFQISFREESPDGKDHVAMVELKE